MILGAGLDSFAYRRSDLIERVRVFEVDHPASQSWKLGRLHDLGIEIPGNLVFAPVDFERQTLREGLVSAGFDFARTAVFSWIGVIMYLTVDAIEATLGTIAQCVPSSEVALTYNQPHRVLDDNARQVTSAFEAIATELGEPFVSLFVPGEIEGLLRSHGFDDIEHFGPQEARSAWFGGTEEVAIAGAQRLIAATVSHSAASRPNNRLSARNRQTARPHFRTTVTTRLADRERTKPPSSAAMRYVCRRFPPGELAHIAVGDHPIGSDPRRPGRTRGLGAHLRLLGQDQQPLAVSLRRPRAVTVLHAWPAVRRDSPPATC